MERMIRLKAIDPTISHVEYGGKTWPVENGYVLVPMAAMDCLTRSGVGFTHIYDAVVVRKAPVVQMPTSSSVLETAGDPFKNQPNHQTQQANHYKNRRK